MSTSDTPVEDAAPPVEEKKLRRLLLNRDSATRSRKKKACELQMLREAVRAVCELKCATCQDVLQPPAIVKDALDTHCRAEESGPAQPFNELEYLRNKALDVEVQLHLAQQEAGALRAENAALRAEDGRGGAGRAGAGGEHGAASRVHAVGGGGARARAERVLGGQRFIL